MKVDSPETLLEEVGKLWDPETQLMSGNERYLIGLCTRLSKHVGLRTAPADTELGQQLVYRALAEERSSLIFGGSEVRHADKTLYGRAAERIWALEGERAAIREAFYTIANEAGSCVDPATPPRETADFLRISSRAGEHGDRVGPLVDPVPRWADHRGAMLSTDDPDQRVRPDDVLSDEAVESACRATIATTSLKDPDKQVPLPRGRLGMQPLWQSYERMIRPALEAAVAMARLRRVDKGES